MAVQPDITPSVLILCINYHSEDETVRFAQSVKAQIFSGRLHLLIVDNSQPPAPNATLALIEQVDVRVLTPADNLGYFGGAAFGLDHYLASHALPDWIIVSNPDIRLDESDFLEQLNALHLRTKCAMIAPRIMSSLTGDNQNPFMKLRPGKSLTSFREQIARNVLVYNAYELLSHLRRGLRGIVKRSKDYLVSDAGQTTPIYAPHGSFLVFNRAYFEAGGSLNYEPFLYGEENYVAEIAKQLGLPVLYDPRLKVSHQEHATTGFLKSKAMVATIHDARSYLYKQFYTTTL